MKKKNNLGEFTYDAVLVTIVSIISLIMLYPMLYVVIASLSNSTLLTSHKGLLWFPLGFNINAYIAVFKSPSITHSYGNTMFVLFFGLIFNISLTSLGAYFLSRKDVLLKKYIMVFIVITMFFNGGLIPTYLNIRDLGLYNSLWSLIIPVSVNSFNLIIMRTAFMGIPESLSESAQIDGANHFVILLKIILPLSSAVIAVMVLYYGVMHWNSWFSAMIYIKDLELLPVQVRLRNILLDNSQEIMTGVAVGNDQSQSDVSESIKYAAIVIVTVPILTVYPMLQKHFAKGVMIGSLKG